MLNPDSIINLSINELTELIRNVLQAELSKGKEKELLNSKELCEFLGIHPSTLSKWKAENKIPYKKLGKRIFFNREEVMQALKDSNYYRLRAM